MISIVVFSLLLFSVSFLSFKKYRRIYANIKLGKTYSNSNPTSEKLRNMVLIALGQKKMFTRPIPAVFHFFIYAAFVLTQLELLEIILDGFTGSHRMLGHAIHDCCPLIYSSLI